MNRRNEQPEWTDFNDQEPGITLVELFAFLGAGLLADRALTIGRYRRNYGRMLGALAAGLCGIYMCRRRRKVESRFSAR
jgi:hypothetical protein